MSDTTSYVAGTTDLPLFEDTIGAMLDRAVSRWPEREALVSVEQGVRWTYEEFGRRVDELAADCRVRRAGARPRAKPVNIVDDLAPRSAHRRSGQISFGAAKYSADVTTDDSALWQVRPTDQRPLSTESRAGRSSGYLNR